MSALAFSTAACISARHQRLVVVVHGIAHAVLGEAQDLDAGLEGAVLAGLHHVVDGDVHALQHGGQDLAGVEVVLVGVDADRQRAAVGRGLQHAEARGAGCGVDHVRTLGHLALGDFAALDGVVPGSTRVARHVLEDGGVGLGGLDALGIAAGELADQRNVHAADEADLAGLRRHAGQHADEVGAFMLLEHDGLDVRQVHHHVDDGEFQFGIFLGDLLDGGGLGEARRDDRRIALVGEVADRLLALGLVGDFELAIGDAGLGLELLGAVEHAFVEGLVELAADVEHDGGLVVGGEGGGRRYMASAATAPRSVRLSICRLPVVVARSNHNPA